MRKKLNRRPVEPWFNNAVLDGMSIMLALRLKGAPPEDTIEATADIWIYSLWNSRSDWREDLDLCRIEFTFKTIGNHLEYFPTPKAFIGLLSPRANDKPSIEAPKELPRDEEGLATALAIAKGCVNRIEIPKGLTAEQIAKRKEAVELQVKKKLGKL